VGAEWMGAGWPGAEAGTRTSCCRLCSMASSQASSSAAVASGGLPPSPSPLLVDRRTWAASVRALSNCPRAGGAGGRGGHQRAIAATEVCGFATRCAQATGKAGRIADECHMMAQWKGL
jgi:hypothetical protein